MHRFLVSTEILAEEQPRLPRSAERHMKVLRLERREPVELFDGHGRTRRYVWDGGSLVADGDMRSFSSPVGRIALFACVTKGSRWDWTIEKAVELGVDSIVPVISDRSIVRLPKPERAAKAERWRRIAEDAARQSDAVWLPEICAAVDFPEALAMARRAQSVFVGALVSPPAPPILEAVRTASSSGDNAVFIGPEGDFTPAELTSLLEFAKPVSLGPTILRAETAAIFAVSILAAHRDSMCDSR